MSIRLSILLAFIAGTACSDDGLAPIRSSPTRPAARPTASVPCEESVLLARQPEVSPTSELLMLVDRSGSMNTGTRWDTMSSALTTITAELEDSIAFGLMLFPNPGLDGCGPGRVGVRPALNNAAEILTELEQFSPLGATPTATSLRAAGDYLLEGNPNGPHYLLLATDGWPGCNGNLNGSTCVCPPEAPCNFLSSINCLDDVRTASTVLQLREEGVYTFVIGIPGTEEIADLLDTMAVAGGTAIDGKHFPVTNEAELVEALYTITASLVPCVYDLDNPAPSPQHIEVRIDGTPIPRDAERTNGWELLGPERLALFGEACDTLRDGSPHQIEAFIECDDP